MGLNNFTANLQVIQNKELVNALCTPLAFDTEIQRLPENFKGQLKSLGAPEILLVISAKRYGTHKIRVYPMRVFEEVVNGASLLRVESRLGHDSYSLFGSAKQKVCLHEDAEGNFKFSISFENANGLFGAAAPPARLVEWLPNLISLFDFRIGRVGGLFS